MSQENYKTSKSTFTLKLLLFPFLLLVALVISFLIGTETIAHDLELPPGPYWGLENPFEVFSWAISSFVQGSHQGIIVHGMSLSFGWLLLFYFLIYVFFFIEKYNFEKTDTHGSAQFADFQDIFKMGLLNKAGLYIGGFLHVKEIFGFVYKNVILYLRDLSDTHCIVVAPTRSGKTIGLGIPNLTTWLGSLFAFDLKGELYLLTSKYRKEVLNNYVIAFYPSNNGGLVEKFKFKIKDPNGAEIVEKLIKRGFLKNVAPNKVCLAEKKYTRREDVPELLDNKYDEIWYTLQQILFGETGYYNPLDFVRMGQQEVSDAQNIINILVDPHGEDKLNHWDKACKSLLLGLILHCLYACKNKTIQGVIALLTSKSRSHRELFTSMLKTVHDPNGDFGWVDEETGLPTKTHPTISSVASEFLKRRDEEIQDIVSTTMTNLELYRDPVISKWMSKSSFTIADLIRADKPLSLYLIIPPNEKNRLRPLARLLINQTCSRTMENVGIDPNNLNQHKHKLLLMLDEFASLGKLSLFEESLSHMATYGMRCLLIVQDIAQLKKNYGEFNTIFSQCKIRIVFATNSISTANDISIMLGGTTLMKKSKSHSETGLSNANEGLTETRRDLMTKDEIMRLNKTEQITFIEGERPILGKKIVYYTNPDFKKRVSNVPIEQSDCLPSKNDFLSLIDVAAEYVPEASEKPKVENIKNNNIKENDIL